MLLNRRHHGHCLFLKLIDGFDMSCIRRTSGKFECQEETKDFSRVSQQNFVLVYIDSCRPKKLEARDQEL